MTERMALNTEFEKYTDENNRIYFVPSNLTIIIYESYPYEIELEKITCSTELLSCIFQLRGKEWFYPITEYEFISCFAVAFKFNFGGGDFRGNYGQWDWKKKKIMPHDK